MSTETDPPIIPSPSEASLICGGPFFRAQRALGLIRANQWNLGRRIAFFTAITWLPPLLITIILNPRGLHSFLLEYPLYARLVIGMPALIVGELFMESRFRAVLAHIHQASLLGDTDLASLDKVIASMVRARDAFLPELAVLVLLIVHTATTYRGLVDPTTWLGQGTGSNFHLTVAGWYVVLVSAPLFQFLLGLGLWKWLLWTYFAFKLSKFNLKLVATHPDGHGGLGFLGLTASAFAPVAFAAAMVIGATWRHDILHHGAHLMDYKLDALVLVTIIALVALGPLLFFVPRLAALRRKGILEYGILGQNHCTEFHEKWILHRSEHDAEFLTAPDSSILADFSKSYETVEQLKPFPADKGSLYTLAAAVAIPALPLVLAVVPLDVVLKDLLRALR
jgi:hypothetical protein